MKTKKLKIGFNQICFCSTESFCISKSLLCDGINHCQNGEDESNIICQRFPNTNLPNKSPNLPKLLPNPPNAHSSVHLSPILDKQTAKEVSFLPFFFGSTSSTTPASQNVPQRKFADQNLPSKSNQVNFVSNPLNAPAAVHLSPILNNPSAKEAAFLPFFPGGNPITTPMTVLPVRNLDGNKSQTSFNALPKPENNPPSVHLSPILDNQSAREVPFLPFFSGAEQTPSTPTPRSIPNQVTRQAFTLKSEPSPTPSTIVFQIKTTSATDRSTAVIVITSSPRATTRATTTEQVVTASTPQVTISMTGTKIEATVTTPSSTQEKTVDSQVQNARDILTPTSDDPKRYSIQYTFRSNYTFI